MVGRGKEKSRLGVSKLRQTGEGEDRFGVFAGFAVGEARMRLRWIPPGGFLMGSPGDEAGRWTCTVAAASKPARRMASSAKMLAASPAFMSAEPRPCIQPSLMTGSNGG